MRRSFFLFALFASVAMSCRPPPAVTASVETKLAAANLSDPTVDYSVWPAVENYGLWADAGRLLGVYSQVPEAALTGACPKVTKDSTGLVVKGDCGASPSRAFGSITVLGDTLAPTQITYDTFRTIDQLPSLCLDVQKRGEVTIDRKHGTDVRFTIQIVREDGNCSNPRQVRTLVDYSGLMKIVKPDADGDGWPEEAIFSGQGTYASPAGRVQVVTDAQHFDKNLCASKAISGTTTITSGADTIEIDYDGATHCTNTVSFSKNGTVQGEIDSGWSL
jgi:hypothetical protein